MATQVSVYGRARQEKAADPQASARATAAANGLRRAMVWIFKRMQRVRSGSSNQKHMHLIESLALGNRRQLLLVICDNQRFLVGVGPDNVGSILAMESPANREPCAMPKISGRMRPVERASKGLKLVTQVPQQGHSEKEAGPALWQ